MADEPVMGWAPVGHRQVGSCIVCGCRVDPTEVVLEPVDPERPKGKQRRLTPLVRIFATFDEPVLYCVDHVHHGREVKRSPRRQGFGLTTEERAAIFRGDHPQIVREPGDELPELGRSYELSDLVSVTFTHEGRNKRSEVKYRYRVFDQRGDRPHLLRQNPPAHRSEHDEEDRLHPLTPALEAKAAEESAYTTSKLSAVPNEPEATSDQHRRALAATGRLARAEAIDRERAEEQAKAQARSINESVRDVLMGRARLGLDVESEGLADLHRAMEKLKAENEASQDAVA